jgi:hypothetical protein
MSTEYIQNLNWIVLAAIALYGLPVDAGAQDLHLKKTVQAGHDVVIFGHARWNNDCSVKEIGEVSLDMAPRHGIVCVRFGEINIRQAFRGGTGCIGQNIRGVRVVYYANSGPAATDELQYTVRYTDWHRTGRALIDIRPGRRSSALPKDLVDMPPGYTQPLERVAPCSPLVS